MKLLILLSCLLSLTLSAAPTDERVWSSSAGTTIKASAIGYQKGQVELKTNTGRVIHVPLDKLIDEDQQLIRKHFEIKEVKPGDPIDSGRAIIEDGLAHPVGQAVGPIDAGNGSTYFIYIPKTLRTDRLVPLMIYNSAGGGKERVVNRYALGAELNGWIIASPV